MGGSPVEVYFRPVVYRRSGGYVVEIRAFEGVVRYANVRSDRPELVIGWLLAVVDKVAFDPSVYVAGALCDRSLA